MAIYSLMKETSMRLLREPESGMGYQIISYRKEAIVIFNASLAISLNDLRSRKFKESDYSLLSGDPEYTSKQAYEPLQLMDDFRISFSLFESELRTDQFGLSFTESVVAPPDYVISRTTPTSYYRYSAYYRDRRVDKDGNYIPGTYATTYADMHFVPSGFAAVGRYALPNPASARYVFQIVTFDKPSLVGTATPNFGQAGGGVEVLFKNGAKNKPGNSFPINVG